MRDFLWLVDLYVLVIIRYDRKNDTDLGHSFSYNPVLYERMVRGFFVYQTQ